jgi:hypothetical protein
LSRQGQALLDLGDIDAALLQHRALGQVQLVHRHVLQALGHAAGDARQERGAHTPAPRAQAQVQAGRLHLIGVERGLRGDRLLRDQVLDGLAGQNPRGVGVGHRRDTR